MTQWFRACFMITNNLIMMKTIRYFIFALLGCVLAACSTTEKFTIAGVPGTEVYSPQKESVGTINSDGKLKVKVPSDAYYAFFYTYDRTSDLWVPFALDVKTNRHNGTKAAMYGGYSLMCAGLAPLLTGGIMAIAGGDDMSGEGAIFAGIGGAAIFGGMGLGMPAQGRLRQLSYQYNFGYKKNQATNQDLRFTEFMPPAAEANGAAVSNNSRNRKLNLTTSKNSTNKKNTGGKKESSTKANLNLKLPVSKVLGSYSGSGVVNFADNPVMNLESVAIQIERLDNNTVKVQIYYDDEPLFEDAEVYSVSRKKSGGYILKHAEVSDAVITITAKGRLEYRHPAVVLEDGNKYVLIIKAAKTRG